MTISLDGDWLGSGWGLIFDRSWEDFLSPWFIWPALICVALLTGEALIYKAWRNWRRTKWVQPEEILP